MPQALQGVSAREFTDAAAMMRHYAELRARIWGAKPRPAPPAPVRTVAVEVAPTRIPEAAEVELPDPEPADPDPRRPRFVPGAFLGPLHAWGRRRSPAALIIAQVAALHRLNVEDLTGISRVVPIIEARFDAIAAVYLARPDLSLIQIGKLFNRDHTSVLAAVRRRGVHISAVERARIAADHPHQRPCAEAA